MIFKSRSIATKLLLLSCFSAVIVIVAIVAFIKLSMIPRLPTRRWKIRPVHWPIH